MKKSRNVKDLHHLRLMALLHELAQEKGHKGAARVLGIDPKTVAACMEGGRLSRRVREALERGLQSRAGSAAARQRVRNEALGQRIEALEGKTRSGLEDARTAIKGESKALREERAKALRQLERRLARLEARQGAQGASEATSAAVKKPRVRPAWGA